jgi:hypothetical protein
VPSTQVEFSDGDKALDRVVDVRQSEEDLRMSHKIRDAFEHRAWLEDKSRQRNSTQVGAWSQLADDVGQDIALILVYDRLIVGVRVWTVALDRRSVACSVPSQSQSHVCGRWKKRFVTN